MTKSKKKTHKTKWLLSLLAGMLITLTLYHPSNIKEIQTPVYAWWGTLYPQYCFSADTETTESTKEPEKSAPVKIDFRWLRIK